MEFIANPIQFETPPSNALAIVFFQDLVLLDTSQQDAFPKIINLNDLDKNWSDQANYYFLGSFKGLPLYAVEIKKDRFEENPSLVPIRKALETMNEFWFKLLCRAKQLIQWDQTSVYCSSCGSKTVHSKTETAKECLNCKRIIYPAASPAAIVLVTNRDKILLARSHHFRPGLYSALAGFIEPAETAEQAVHREVMEEVGIEVKNIRYFGNQYWPFPNSFMIGFHAEYASGEIKIEPNEIEDAKWFNKNNLPDLPYQSSIARRLIESALAKLS
jgi:NAD+ diphosphatase